METSLCLTEILNVLTAISQQDDKQKKKNIILANKGNEFLISVVKYHLDDPKPGFDPVNIYKPCFHIADPPDFTKWDGLMEYFRDHRDVEDKLVAAQRFIQLKPWDDREGWKKILSRTFVLGNEQYLKTVISQEEKLK